LGAPRWSAHPYLSAVVRDLIRLACCWTMAKSPGVAVRRGHHLVVRDLVQWSMLLGDASP
ncbi:hypothetical protein, partial [Aeromonas sp. QDB41]